MSNALIVASACRIRFVWILPVILMLAGCGESLTVSRSFHGADESSPAASNSLKQLGLAPSKDGGQGQDLTVGGEGSAAANRKIIYNAQIDLVVESVGSTAQAVERLVKANGGYIAGTDVSSFTHASQNATWKVRVPVDRFETFVTAIAKLGELQRNHIDSQDVTQEYHDLEAQIRNKQQEEKRLLKHLEESTGKLADILAVEKELSRVRGEIEQMQGRIRYLANLSSLTTVTITASEIRTYEPPVVASFSTRIGRTFRASAFGLVDFGKLAVLVLVAALPWVPVLLVPILLIRWLARRRRAFRQASTV